MKRTFKPSRRGPSSLRSLACAALAVAGFSAGVTGCDDSKKFNETKSTNISVDPTLAVYDPVAVGQQSVARVFNIRQDGETNLKVSGIYLRSSQFADADRCDRVDLGIGRNDPLPADLAENCHFVIEVRGDGSELPWELGVNVQRQVNVAYNSLGTPPSGWSLVVESNALNQPSFVIPLSVRAEQPVFAGDTEKGFPLTGGTEFISIRNSGSGNLNVNNFTVQYLTDVPVDPVTQQPKQEFRIQANRELPWAIDNLGAETLTIIYEPIDEEPDVAEIVFTSDNAIPAEYRVRLTSQAVQSVIVVEPNPVVFGQPSRTERESRREIVVANRGLRSFDVRSILIDQPNSGADQEYRLDPATPTSFQLRPGDAQTLVVTYTPVTNEGSDASLLITNTADVGADDQQLTYVPMVRSGDRLPALLNIDPPVLQFNDVAGGEAGSRTLTLTNPGAQPLEVSRIGLSTSDDGLEITTDPEFAVTAGGGAVTIAAGESHTVEITLSRGADDRRALAGILVVDSNADPARSMVFLSSSPVPAN